MTESRVQNLSWCKDSFSPGQLFLIIIDDFLEPERLAKQSKIKVGCMSKEKTISSKKNTLLQIAKNRGLINSKSSQASFFLL